jgi:hypothetical protein
LYYRDIFLDNSVACKYNDERFFNYTEEVSMPKRIIIAALCLCIGAVHVIAQTSEDSAEMRRWFIGAEGGYAYNTLYTETGYRPFSQYESGHGFRVGIPVRFVIFDWLALQSGVQFIQKNYSSVRTNDDKIYANYTNSFIEFPLLVQVSTKVGIDDLRLFATAGAELGVWVAQHQEGSAAIIALPGYNDDRDTSDIKYQSFNEDIAWNDTRDNRFTASLVAGLGVAYTLKPCTFYIEGRYHFGLTDLEKAYQRNKAPRINDTVSVSAGVLFNADIFNIFGGAK